MEQVELNRRWPDATGDDLTRMQGEARAVRRMKKIIVEGPVIKEVLTRGGGQ